MAWPLTAGEFTLQMRADLPDIFDRRHHVLALLFREIGNQLRGHLRIRRPIVALDPI